MNRWLRACSLIVALAAGGGVQAVEPGLPMTPARHIAFDTDEGTWLSASVTRDGRSVIFDILGDLYAVEAKGGAVRAITRGMAFDSQPTVSPDGERIAFVSDRSGAENVWTARLDGSDLRQVTHNDTVHEFVSPTWSADGREIFVSLYRSDRNAMGLWRYPANGPGAGEELTKSGMSALGAVPAPDGRHLYVAEGPANVFEDDVVLPLWSIHRLDLKTGADETIVTNQGSAMRPAVSPDGRWLAYAARLDGHTQLRLRDLSTGADRLLAPRITRDLQEALPSRDLVPGYDFTPDGRAVVISVDGKLVRIDLASGAQSPIPFQAHVALDLGRFLRQRLQQEQGPVRGRLIQAPVQSPDGRSLAFSAVGRLYVMDLKTGASHAVVASGPPQFEPAWSPDGRELAYVTWTAAEGGQVWRVSAGGEGAGTSLQANQLPQAQPSPHPEPVEGRGAAPSVGPPSSPHPEEAKGDRLRMRAIAAEEAPRQVTAAAAYYTSPVYAPDGRALLALRSSAYDRMHTAQEPLFTGRTFGPLRQAELVALPIDGGAAQVLASGQMSGAPQFTRDASVVFVNTDKGLEAVARDGSGERRLALSVTAPGYYFLETHVAADELQISPDGASALVLTNQQLHVIAMPARGAAATAIDLDAPSAPHRRLTSVGADFAGWADGGRTITWAVGSTFYRQPLQGVTLDPPGEPSAPERPQAGVAGVEAFRAAIDLPRDTPHGVVVLRGATVITMRGNEVIPDADVVVVDNHISLVGARGAVAVPAGAWIEDVSGRWITPGFIDVHDHFGEVRRGVLQFDDWGLRATLAYGVTTSLDPSTLSIDMLAYQDALDAGLMVGPRLYSTATAVFSYNQIGSLQDARDIVSRYVEHYRTHNLKEYRTGPRRVRQWLAMAAAKQGSMPTTEGALDMKLDLTQIIDGYSGNEHSLGAVPLYRDVVELIAQSKVSYDLTLMISHGGPPGGEDFITRTAPHGDAKLRGLYPHFILDRLFSRVRWVDPKELAYPMEAASVARVARAGGVVGVGSHGNYPGIGYLWELQAYASGGMTPMEVLHAATLGSAETIGRAGELGSLEPGKFADLLVFDKNPLADIRNTAALREVMKNGRLYPVQTLLTAPDELSR